MTERLPKSRVRPEGGPPTGQDACGSSAFCGSGAPVEAASLWERRPAANVQASPSHWPAPLRLLATALAISATLQHSLLWAAPPLPAGTLPVPAAAWVASGAASRAVSGANLTITQQSQRAVLDWQSFNVSADAKVRFDQPNASAAALNRIHDANPSVIQGQLSANGEVYLINANGILFDRGAQVNVGGLVASALGISQDTFNAGLLSVPQGQAAFSFGGDAEAFARSEVKVEAGASITTANGGRVMLLAPKVTNAGSIATPQGQAVLAGGDKVYLALPSSADLRGFLVEVDPHASGGGSVVNDVGARVHAERGNVTLVATKVRQDGQASATSSVSLNGSVRLLARDGVTPSGDTIVANNGGALTLGAHSVTAVSTDADPGTARQDAPFSRSQVELAGRTVHLEGGAQVRAPGGQVTVSAQRGALFQAEGTVREDVRLQIDPGARIDVSGEQDVAVELTRNVVGVELRGDELKDSPLQRDGPLRNKTVFVDAREGTPLAGVSGALAGIETGARERNATGGDITLRSEGDLIVRAGSVLDVSGGSVQWQAGLIETTVLVGADGRLYDIAAASPDRRYVALAGRYAVTDSKWGVTREFRTLPGRWDAGYVQGRPAGSITVQARRVVLDGELRGAVVNGPRQRELADRAAPGRLILGNAGAAAQTIPDFMLPDLRLDTVAAPTLGADFSFGTPDALTPLPPSAAERLVLDPARLAAGGIGHIEAYANGTVTVAAGAPLSLAPGGSLALTGSRVAVGADLSVPAGSIVLRSRVTATTVAADADTLTLAVADGVTLAARGLWTNDALTGSGTGLLAPDAGRISLASAADLTLGAGSLLDLTGGGTLDEKGAFTPGAGGAITLVSGEDSRISLSVANPYRVHLNGELRGHGLGAGGSLAITSAKVQIGGAAPADSRVLHLDPAFFGQGGFGSYAVTGRDGLTLAAGATLAPQTQTLVPDTDFATRPTGSDVRDFTTPALLLPALRPGTDLRLSTVSGNFGDLLLDAGSTIRTDPGAEVRLTSARQLTVLGTVEAPAGSITLETLPGGDTADSYLPGQSIWLGAQARLLARGHAQVQSDALGLRRGQVLGGGSITLDAGEGYVVAQAGALLDASGTAAAVDLPPVGGVGAPIALTLASNGGRIRIQGREGLLLDATLRAAAGGAGAIGGSLEVALDRPEVPNVGFPSGPVRLEVRPDGTSVPAGLLPGQDIPDALNGRGLVTAGAIAAGGFTDLTLLSRNRIQFTGDVDLALAGNVVLEAPEAGVDAGVDAQVSGAYLRLGNLRNLVAPGAPTPGDGTLTLRGDFVDLAGNVSVHGAGLLALDSRGDIRGRGLLADSFAQSLTGALRSGGDITLRGAQVYPATLSDYRVEAAGTLRVAQADGPAAAPPLSAGGSLTLVAGTGIEQAGTLRAPFGRIGFEAPVIALADGSLTSVSGAGLLVPFGSTELTGRDWAYRLSADSVRVLKAPPEKRVTLAGQSLDLAPGATVDLGGGGDLVAHEFLPGPGGSFNVLAPALTGDSFAVLPALGAGYAPHDHQAALGGAPATGALVYLEGVPGLAAGDYVRLPASYALLPGAYLVTALPGNAGLPGAPRPLAQGGVVVAGRDARMLAGGTVVRAPLAGDFLVRSGSQLRRLGEYAEARAGTFFAGVADAQLPADAGRLSLAATDTLRLAGTLRTAPAAGGRGAELDITAPRLALLGAGAVTPGPGWVTLDAAALNGLGVSSLLLGGTRALAGDVLTLAVGTSELVVDTAGVALAGPELILAATDTLSVRAGSVLEGRGAGAPGRGLTVGQDGDGDGALIRLAGGAQATLTRQNVDRNRGDLLIEAGAVLRARGAARLDATREHLLGAGVLDLADGAALALAGGQVSLGAVPGGTGGLVLGSADVAALAGLGALELRSYAGIDVYGDLALGSPALAALTLDGGGLRGFGGDLTLRGQVVTLTNTTGGSAAGGAAGALRVEAGRLLLADTGAGAFALSGYGQADLTAGDILARGRGTLAAGGDLTLRAARLAAAGGTDYALTAAGTLAYLDAPAGAALPAVSGLGGRLALSAAAVNLDGRVTAPSGTLAVNASASGGITLGGAAVLDLAGRTLAFGSTTRASGGGSLTLAAALGDVLAQTGSVVDVSGAPGADGGLVEVRAPLGTTRLDGTLRAGADALPGQPAPAQGRFVLDAGTLTDFAALNTALEAGRFTHERLLRVRSGDLAVGPDVAITARRFELALDSGDLTFAGAVDASGPKGGRIALFAGGDLTLAPGALLDAHATGPAAAYGSAGRGGEVTLGVRDGTLNLAAGTGIDVSAGAGATDAQGGRVLLRAARAGADVAIGALDTTITGARELVVEAVRVYEGVSTLAAFGGGVGTLDLATIAADDTAYMGGVDAIRTRLGQGGNAAFHLRPGTEVRSAGDLTVSGDLNLQPLRAGGEPGVLTLRAAGSLNLNGSISDGFSTAATTGVLQGGPSWSYRLVAGADFGAADPLATVAGAASDVTVGAGRLVRTGSGRIELAAARDLTLAANTSVIYTAGMTGPALADFTPPSVGGVAAQFPVDGGDLRIAVGRDVAAAPATQLPTAWLHRQGRANADGTMAPANRTAWWLRYNDFRQGVGALGGGDVDIRAGGDVTNLGVSIPTTARLPVPIGGQPDPDALVVQGGGDLYLAAEGDIGSALLLLGGGTGTVRAGGDIAAARSAGDQPVNALALLGDATLALHAGGDVVLDGVANPTALTQVSGNLSGLGGANRRGYFLSYGAGAVLDARSLGGAIEFTLNSLAVQSGYGGPTSLSTVDFGGLRLAPPSVYATTFGGDVRVDQNLLLAPAPRGQLELLAAGDVDLAGGVTLSDVDPRRSAGGTVASPSQGFGTLGTVSNSGASGALAHARQALHLSDPQPVRIAAGADIVGSPFSSVILPKAAIIEAGGDVRDLWLAGQNLAATDVTRIAAGGSVRYATPRSVTGAIGSSNSRLELGGPGRLEVLAGDDVDLGTGGGIVTRGNLNNPFLPEQGAAVTVMSGLGAAPAYGAFAARYLDPASALSAPHRDTLLAYLRSLGQEPVDAADAYARFAALDADLKQPLLHDVFFAELRATGRAAVAEGGSDPGRYRRGFEAIATLFPGAGAEGSPYRGDISLFFSQIRTDQGGNIDLFAPGGRVNAGLVGVSGFNKPANELGIVTAAGGSVRSLVDSDFLVNQSRVFTLGGGDILLWSSRGNIDAGRGAKGVGATPPPKLVRRGDQFVLDTSRSVNGSGIGVLLSRPDIVPGDVDLIAPNGEVNAGDAGIRSAGNLTIAAPRVVGADNIQVGGVSAGVPVTSTAVSGSVAGTAAAGSTATKAAADAAVASASAAAAAGVDTGLGTVVVDVLGFEG